MDKVSSVPNKAITDALTEFSQKLSSKFNLKYEDVISIWNEASELKAPVSYPSPSVTFLPTVAMSSASSAPTAVKVESKSGGCSFTITRGDRKGQLCGKKVVENSTCCSSHNKNAKTETVVKAPTSAAASTSIKNTCMFKITRGDRKDQLCGKTCARDNPNYCSSHKTKGGPVPVNTPTPTTFTSVPASSKGLDLSEFTPEEQEAFADVEEDDENDENDENENDQ